MYNLINKLSPDTEGVSNEELKLVMNYAKSYVTGDLRFPAKKIAPELKEELEKLMEDDIATMKKWSRL